MNDLQTLEFRQELQLKCFSTKYVVRNDSFEKLQVKTTKIFLEI